MANKLSHIDDKGKANMVDVGSKTVTQRYAKAIALVEVSQEILALFSNEDIETKKGPVFQTAILAGIMAAKKTSELIPLCHPLGLDKCNLSIKINREDIIEITAETSIAAKTGVEMEALTAASIAALTIYDMCKSYGHNITIKEIKLLEKSGGKSAFKSSQI